MRMSQTVVADDEKTVRSAMLLGEAADGGTAVNIDSIDITSQFRPTGDAVGTIDELREYVGSDTAAASALVDAAEQFDKIRHDVLQRRGFAAEAKLTVTLSSNNGDGEAVLHQYFEREADAEAAAEDLRRMEDPRLRQEDDGFLVYQSKVKSYVTASPETRRQARRDNDWIENTKRGSLVQTAVIALITLGVTGYTATFSGAVWEFALLLFLTLTLWVFFLMIGTEPIRSVEERFEVYVTQADRVGVPAETVADDDEFEAATAPPMIEVSLSVNEDAICIESLNEIEAEWNVPIREGAIAATEARRVLQSFPVAAFSDGHREVPIRSACVAISPAIESAEGTWNLLQARQSSDSEEEEE